MALLKLETHFFTKNMKTPESKDISILMNLFAKDELLPQYFEERNIAGKSSKHMMFVNPIEGKSIRFLSDRVVITNELNPFNVPETSNIVEKLTTFKTFSSNCIKAYEGFYGSELLAHRVALVVNVIIQSDNKEKFATTLLNSLPWKSENYIEVKFRTGEKIENVFDDESINFLTSIDDGVIEQNQNGQVTNKNDCFLVLLDLSTDNINNISRISITKFEKLIDILSTYAVKREKELTSFFEGK